MKRTLTLRREALADLTAGDLSSLAAGANIITNVTCPIATLPVRDCIIVNPPTLPPRCHTTPVIC